MAEGWKKKKKSIFDILLRSSGPPRAKNKYLHLYLWLITKLLSLFLFVNNYEEGDKDLKDRLKVGSTALKHKNLLPTVISGHDWKGHKRSMK